MQFFKSTWDRLTGRGEAAVTIPAMDGPLTPNSALDAAATLLPIENPDNLVAGAGRTIFSSGRTVYELKSNGEFELLQTFDLPVTALAVSPDSTVAIALEGGPIMFTGRSDIPKPISVLESGTPNCVTAMAFGDSSSLYICNGSSKHPLSRWQQSLMEHDQTGTVWRIDTQTGTSLCLKDKLGFPHGIIVEPGEPALIVSEAWKHSIVRIVTSPNDVKPSVVLDNLPGYPARLSRGKNGSIWLAVFAPRSQLIEFVLHEHKYRQRMMDEIEDPNLWIAPTLRSKDSFLEILQAGAVKQLGILKPWAPTRSYGLIIHLNAQYRPVTSFHSRADGYTHGIRSCLWSDGRVIGASSGGNRLFSFQYEG